MASDPSLPVSSPPVVDAAAWWQRYQRPLLLHYLGATVVALVAGLLQPRVDSTAWVRDPRSLLLIGGPAGLTLLIIGAGCVGVMFALGIHTLFRRRNLSKSSWYTDLLVLWLCCACLFLWHMFATDAASATAKASARRSTQYYSLYVQDASTSANWGIFFLVFGLICGALSLFFTIVELWPSRTLNTSREEAGV